MKIRTLFLATTALAALASCSNDELSDANQGSAIRMRAFLNNLSCSGNDSCKHGKF